MVYLLIYRSHLKIRIFGRDQGEAEDHSAGILKYVEDLRRGLNADIGRKDFFEMASKFHTKFRYRPSYGSSVIEQFP